MIKPFLLSIVTALFLYCSAFSQKSKPTQDTVSTSTVIIFNGGNTSYTGKKRKPDDLNIIKIAPLAYLSGKIPFYYERSINDLLSVQVGLGLTSENYIGSAWYEASEEESTDSKTNITYSPLPAGVTDEAEALYGFDQRVAKPGFLFNIQPRFYFEQDGGLEGTFVGLGYEFYKYKYQVPSVYLDKSSTKVNEFENINDIMLYVGTQQVWDTLTLELSAGIGKRNVKGSKYEEGSDSKNVRYTGLNDYTRSVLNFQLSAKIGFHF